MHQSPVLSYIVRYVPCPLVPFPTTEGWMIGCKNWYEHEHKHP